jgi:peptidoglycan/xylan/chitin deacetylase (PgdA/CDA1 family)
MPQLPLLQKILFLLVGCAALLLLILVIYPRVYIRLLAQATPQLTFYRDLPKGSDRVVALTIDDGPYPATTEKILEVLKAKRAHATFFLIGSRIAGQESTVQRLLQEGHEIGNHELEDRWSIRFSDADYYQQLDRSHQVLTSLTSPHWYRPGGGFYRADRLEQVKRLYGYDCALGSVFPNDPRIPWVPFMVWHVVTYIFPGAIIVLHDGPQGRGERTAVALEQILDRLSQQGYRVVNLTELRDCHESSSSCSTSF